jgi:valine--pyruvate aminotransferase
MTPFSDAGARLSGASGIQELMDDLGRAMSSDPHMRMLGGGNPAAIPEVQALWSKRLGEMQSDGTLDRALVNYDPPAGNPHFREAFADFLRRTCGWSCRAENIVVMPGGQTAFFYLFTLLCGRAGGGKKRILFPIAPEYIGYANQSLDPESFLAMRPLIEERRDGVFKYRIDFDRLKITPDIAAVCLSCPTNPTGNVISDAEVARLREICSSHGIPLMLDQAYGRPFPGAIFVDWTPVWGSDMIVSLSLSKLGLPGTRTSVIVADERITSALANMNAVVALANGNIGQTILKPLLEGDTLIRLASETILPFYQERAQFAKETLRSLLHGRVPYALHESEGAFFLWLWLKELPITAAELYQRLKKRKVLVVPGHYFFFGLTEPWEHADQCLRITFSQSREIVKEGLEIIADEILSLMR